jgi:predicted Zn-dependent protease with MMP-like domain
MFDMKGQFDDPRAFRGQAASLADIEALAARSYGRLPAHFRALCEDLVIRVADFPTAEVLDHMGLASRYDLLGLFQGIGLPFRQDVTGQMPNMIWLYRRPILAYWSDREESLSAIVTHVLVHEIGHHFGFSDEDMEAIEASAA